MQVADACVLVPVFNESELIGRTVTDLRAIFHNVVCVDDGSSDGSADVALAAGAVVLRHAVNQGQGAALETGFEYVRRRTTARYVITFDADGQHAVDDAVRMLERARTSGVDVILGTRFGGPKTEIPAARRQILRAAVWFTRLTSRLEVTDTHNGLRVLSRRAVLATRLELPRSAHASEFLSVIAHAGLSYAEEPVTITYTDYSIAKGQRNSNSVNVLYDIAMRRLRSAR